MADGPPIAIIDAHAPGAFAFRIKLITNGAHFCVLPHRDPAQPRFWCVAVVKCGADGLIDDTESGRIARRGLRREELSDTMAAIRTDVSAWLVEPQQQHVRAWMLASQATPPSETVMAARLGTRQGLTGRPATHPPLGEESPA